ncbi:hypothetical protein ACFE04_024688 [Oxalis oulophora]
MGCSGNQVVDVFPLRAPLKPLYIKKDKDVDDDDEECNNSTTPRGDEARIPARLTCPPPPPRKRKPSFKCNYGRGRDFFIPPDLETRVVATREDKRRRPETNRRVRLWTREVNPRVRLWTRSEGTG